MNKTLNTFAQKCVPFEMKVYTVFSGTHLAVIQKFTEVKTIKMVISPTYSTFQKESISAKRVAKGQISANARLSNKKKSAKRYICSLCGFTLYLKIIDYSFRITSCAPPSTILVEETSVIFAFSCRSLISKEPQLLIVAFILPTVIAKLSFILPA